MSVPEIVLTDLGGKGSLLILGPSLGTRATTLWRTCATRLVNRHRVLAWDLPGHGASPAAVDFSFTDLVAGVVAALTRSGVDHRAPFTAAGDSLGGAVALQLALDLPDRITGAVVACSGPHIGTPDGWRQRADDVLAGGLRADGAVRAAASARWFGPRIYTEAPDLVATLLEELGGTDPASYAACALTLAEFDIRDRLAEIVVPVLAIAGADDQVTPASLARHVANGVVNGRAVVLEGVAHLAPAEAPEDVADLILQQLEGIIPPSPTAADTRARGMRVRREVLGDHHVDNVPVTNLTVEFQQFITQYAWGDIWTRPGLDRRSRSIVVLTALIAGGHHDELAMHLRAALRNGLTVPEINEVLLQSAIYCGVPAANTAFRVANQVLKEQP